MLTDDNDGDDQVKEGGRKGGIMQWWGNRQSSNVMSRFNGKENSLDMFTPRTKRRRKRELGWDTGSSCSSDVEATDHGKGGRERNPIQQHLDQMTRKSKQKKKGAQAATPDKYSSLMYISEG